MIHREAKWLASGLIDSVRAWIWNWQASSKASAISIISRPAFEFYSSIPSKTGSINQSQHLWAQKWPWNPLHTALDSPANYQWEQKFVIPVPPYTTSLKWKHYHKDNLWTAKKKPCLSSSLVCIGGKWLVNWELHLALRQHWTLILKKFKTPGPAMVA